ncbi:hypothetical protein ACXWPL_09310, partial [Streptococcus pyogenes]
SAAELVRGFTVALAVRRSVALLLLPPLPILFLFFVPFLVLLFFLLLTPASVCAIRISLCMKARRAMSDNALHLT